MKKEIENTLRKIVPRFLELDSINGSYWISVVAFTMNQNKNSGIQIGKLHSFVYDKIEGKENRNPKSFE